MRYVFGLLSLLALSPLGLSSPGQVQQRDPQDIRVLRVDAEVRAESSDKAHSYVTNRLSKGDAVEVLEEHASGWLAIRPPANSTSWINTRFLKHLAPGPNYVLALDGVVVPVFPTHADRRRERPGVISGRLQQGQQVTTTGQKFTDNQNETWMEIESWHREVRYIRAEAVEKTTTPNTLQVGTAATATNLQPSTAPSANSVSAAEELRSKAVAADTSHNVAEAVRLYDQIVARFGVSHPELARMSRQRADYLRHSLDASHTQPERINAVPVNTGGRQETRTHQNSRTASVGEPAQDAKTLTYQGWLSPEQGRFEGNPKHLLDMRQMGKNGALLLVAGPGVNLRAMSSRWVKVTCVKLNYDTRERIWVMQVTQVTPIE